jgi:hypothetical protein
MGAGGSTSSATITALNNTCINAVQESLKQCITSATNEQMIMIRAGGDITLGNIDQTQFTSIDQNCAISSTMETNIQSAIVNTLKQAAEATGSGITSVLGGSQTNVQAHIQNLVNVNLRQGDVQNTIAGALQKMSVVLEAGRNVVVGNINQSQTSKVIATAIMNSTGAQSVVTTVANAMDQTTKSVTTNPISDIVDSVGSAVGNIVDSVGGIFTGPIMLLLGLVFLVIIAVLVMKNLSKGEAQPALPSISSPENLSNVPVNNLFTPVPSAPEDFSNVQPFVPLTDNIMPFPEPNPYAIPTSELNFANNPYAVSTSELNAENINNPPFVPL